MDREEMHTLLKMILINGMEGRGLKRSRGRNGDGDGKGRMEKGRRKKRHQMS
jgi:hypothetical protein